VGCGCWPYGLGCGPPLSLLGSGWGCGLAVCGVWLGLLGLLAGCVCGVLCVSVCVAVPVGRSRGALLELGSVWLCVWGCGCGPSWREAGLCRLRQRAPEP
jgi:hypothetical protein